MDPSRHLITLLVATASDRNRLANENAALRQQILVLQRGVTRARLDDSDRMFWIFLRRFVRGWRDMLYIVQPETVIRWHRRGFRYYWRKRSTGKPGRPTLTLKMLFVFVVHHNKTRTHLSLDRNAPEPRKVARKGGEIVGAPVLGGLHHKYERAA